MVLPETVKRCLNAHLERASLATTTERQIREHLEQELGESLSPHKKLIKQEVQLFLSRLSEDRTDPVGHKRKLDAQPAAESSDVPEAPNKQARTASTAGEGDKVKLTLAGNRKVSVRKFQGKLLVDIREHYIKDGAELPGKKGIALAPEQWELLRSNLPAIASALEAADLGFVLQLSSTRQVKIGEYKGRTQVDVREYYEKDGALCPGKKGIALSPADFDALSQQAIVVEEALGGPVTLPDHPDAATASAPAAAAAAAASSAGPPSAAAGPSSNGAAEAEGGSVVELGSSRRATVRRYQGNVLLDLREFYEKNGELLPGKKGISLNEEQFKVLHGEAGAITEALAASDAAFQLPLSSKRKVRINIFKGKPLVDVREFYDKDGDERPGQRGISLSPEQWQTLIDKLEALRNAAQRLH